MSAAELLRAATSDGDPLRAAVFLTAIAFCELDEGTETELAALVASAWGLAAAPDRARLCFSGLFALRMHRAPSRERLAASILEDYRSGPRKHDASRDLTSFALQDLRVRDATLAQGIERCIAEGLGEVPHLGATLWSALASRDPSRAHHVIQAARDGDGYAREAVESIESEQMLPALSVLAESERTGVYGDDLAASACEAMLSIGSAESLALFEQLMQQRRSAPITALEDGVHPRAVGLLLRFEANANAFEHARVVTSAARRAASALMRRVCAPSEIARACQSIRDDIEGISTDPESLGVALRILAELGDAEDRDLVRLWCPRITSPGVRRELEAMLERRDG